MKPHRLFAFASACVLPGSLLLGSPIHAAKMSEADVPDRDGSVAPAPGPAPQPVPAFSTCEVNLEHFWTNCSLATDDVGVDMQYDDGVPTAVAEVELNGAVSWNAVIVRVEICNGGGYTVNIGDSSTNNGHGGDAGSTRHDAEIHSKGTTLYAYRSDIGGSGELLRVSGPDVLPVPCAAQQWTVAEDHFSFDPEVSVPYNETAMNDPALFDFPHYDEADSEDPSHLEENTLFVSLNRVISWHPSRTGKGVQRACFHLSSGAAPTLNDVEQRCGF
jgi:hypothetical protein